MATGFTNECNVITIFPLGVTCFPTNPSCSGSSDGVISLFITGGTPPYNVTWANQDKSFVRQNLPAGSYPVTVKDYYNDYSVDVVCTLTQSDIPCLGVPYFSEETVIDESFEIESSVTIPLSIDTSPPLSLDYSINHPVCGCDGNIVLIANYGYPPYTFSINGNLTSKSFPFFDNLCSGNYYLTVNDSSGNTANNFVVMNPPSDPTTYTISLNTFSNLVQNNSTSKIVNYTNTFSITPPLPDNTTITFDLIHSNVVQSSPNQNSAVSNTSSVFSKNGSGITISFSSQTTGTSVNTIDGCQDNSIYFTSFTESWNQVQINSSDTLSLITQTSLTKIDDVTCYYSNDSDTFSIANVTISGCSCCNVRTISP